MAALNTGIVSSSIGNEIFKELGAVFPDLLLFPSEDETFPDD